MGFSLNESSKETTGMLTDVMFAYIKLQTGAYKYESKTEREYSVVVIVDKATAKAFKKKFPKNGYKEVDNEDFEKIFKVPVPFPEQEEQYKIKLTVDCALKTDVPTKGLKGGDLVPYSWASRPKMFIPVEGGVKDVTMSVLASNGSTGDVAFKVMSNKFGTFPQMTGILVKNLIPYEGGEATTPFGSVVGGYDEGDGNPQQQAQAPEDSSEEDSDSTPSQGITDEESGSEGSSGAPGEAWDDDIPF